MHRTCVAALLMLSTALGGAASAQEEPADSLRDVEVRRLVWAAADAPEPTYAKALAELRGLPGVTWNEVHDILAAGRDSAALRPLKPEGYDEESHARLMEDVPWEPGVVRAFDFGDTPEGWYDLRLPQDYTGDEPLAVMLNLGGISGDCPYDPAPDGWAIVSYNVFLERSRDLGGERFNLMGGTASQCAVLSIVADLERRVNIDRNRVFVGGHDRGGTAALYVGTHWPGLFAGIVTSAGHYPVESDTLHNLEHVAVLIGRGPLGANREVDQFTKKFVKGLAKIPSADLVELVGERGAFGARVAPPLSGGIQTHWIGWASERERDPLPRDFRYVLHDPRHRGAYWAEILEVANPGGVRESLVGTPRDPRANRVDVNRKAASFHVKVIGANEIDVDRRNVAKLRLFLSPALFDLTEDVKIRARGRAQSIAVVPTVGTLLQNFRRDRDRTRLFPATIDLVL